MGPESPNQTNVVFFFINHTLSASSNWCNSCSFYICLKVERKVRSQKNSSEIHAGMLGYVDMSEREDEIYEEDREKGENV